MHIGERAVLIMNQENADNAGKSSLAINIQKNKSVTIAHVKAIKKVGKADTYNLEVKDTHNFIANGVIVHNSVDATRYIIRVFADSGRCPII